MAVHSSFPFASCDIFTVCNVVGGFLPLWARKHMVTAAPGMEGFFSGGQLLTMANFYSRDVQKHRNYGSWRTVFFFWFMMIYGDLWWSMVIYVFFGIHLKSPLITTTNKLNSTFGQRFLAAIDPLSQLVDSSCDLTETPQQSLGAGERGDSDPLDPCYENYLLGALNHLKTASIVLKMYFWGLNLTWNIHKSSFPATNSCSPLETPLLGIAEVHLWET